MIVALLILIALILLFSAGVVKGWMRNIAGAAIGIILLAAAILVLSAIFGESAFVWICTIGGTLLLMAVLWARQYDPAEAERSARHAEHKRRVERAKSQRDERKRRAEADEEARSTQTPLETLMSVFNEYHARTIPATKAKAEQLYAFGDEEGMRKFVESICERNMDRLVFDGKIYHRQVSHGGGAS